MTRGKEADGTTGDAASGELQVSVVRGPAREQKHHADVKRKETWSLSSTRGKRNRKRSRCKNATGDGSAKMKESLDKSRRNANVKAIGVDRASASGKLRGK